LNEDGACSPALLNLRELFPLNNAVRVPIALPTFRKLILDHNIVRLVENVVFVIGIRCLIVAEKKTFATACLPHCGHFLRDMRGSLPVIQNAKCQ